MILGGVALLLLAGAVVAAVAVSTCQQLVIVKRSINSERGRNLNRTRALNIVNNTQHSIA